MGYGPIHNGEQGAITPWQGSWAQQEEARRGKPYSEQIALARRFDKCVDFGSPMTAWTPAMLRKGT